MGRAGLGLALAIGLSVIALRAPLLDLPHELKLERWLPWDQVHPPEEDELDESEAPDTAGNVP